MRLRLPSGVRNLYLCASTLRPAPGSACFPIRKGRKRSVEVGNAWNLASTHSCVFVASSLSPRTTLTSYVRYRAWRFTQDQASEHSKQFTGHTGPAVREGALPQHWLQTSILSYKTWLRATRRAWCQDFNFDSRCSTQNDNFLNWEIKYWRSLLCRVVLSD